ncbi:MAG: NUDIX hydrolase [Patescibacteria group bacterium]
MNKKIQKWEELSREVIWQKYSRKIEKVVFRLPDNKESDFYIKKEGPAVGILALTTNKEVILVKQFRPGPKKILNEIPGGFLEPGETPIQTATRELLEETGYRGKVTLVTTALDCAYSTMNRYCLVATECEKAAKQTLDETEFADVVLMPLGEFRDLLRSGKLTDIEVGYLGLDYLKLL